MPYSLPADVRNALNKGGIGDDDITGASLDDDQLEDQIEEADATINNYIGRFYTVPVDTTGGPVEPLRSWSRDIAAYLATLAFRMAKDFTERDPVALRYNHAMRQLQLVLAGEMTLPLPEVTGDAVQDSAVVTNLYEGDLFTPGDFSLHQDPAPGWQEGRW